MTGKKIIAVVGATGQQGGGLARGILDDPDSEFTVRAITRNPESDAAKELALRGAEVVQADIDDEASVVRAFEGAYGAFLVTNFWEHLSTEREYAQAGNLARAAKTAGIAHAIWSTLEDVRETVPLDDDRMPTLLGKYKVPHCDIKAESDLLFTEAGVPTTFLVTAFYFDNFTSIMRPTRQEDGSLALAVSFGDSKVPSIAVEDIGRSALGIFKRGQELVGQTIAIATEHLTGAEFAQAFTEVLGEPVAYVPVPHEAVRAAGTFAAEDTANMFQYFAEFSETTIALRDPKTIRELTPSPQPFKDWLVAHKEAFASI